MKFTHMMLLGVMALAVVACKNEETPPVVPPPAPEGSGHRTHPDAAKWHAVWGAITSGGQPLTGASITIVRQDEKMDMEGDHEFAFTLDSEYYGESPHELLFAKPGYQSQTHTVTIVREGVELRVDLKPE